MKKLIFLLVLSIPIFAVADSNPLAPNQREAEEVRIAHERLAARQKRDNLIVTGWGIIAGSFIMMQAMCAYNHLPSR